MTGNDFRAIFREMGETEPFWADLLGLTPPRINQLKRSGDKPIPLQHAVRIETAVARFRGELTAAKRRKLLDELAAINADIERIDALLPRLDAHDSLRQGLLNISRELTAQRVTLAAKLAEGEEARD